MSDILTFTKQLSGIDSLVDYVINHIDQNMIIYNILSNIKCNITALFNGTQISYNISNLNSDDINKLRMIPKDQSMHILNTPYRVVTDMISDTEFTISIFYI